MTLLERYRTWRYMRRMKRDYRRLVRLLGQQAECRICGLTAPVLGIWGHQLASECSDAIGDHIDAVRRLFMFTHLGIPVPPKTIAEVIGKVKIQEISEDLEIQAMVIHALAMTPNEFMPNDSPLVKSLEAWDDAEHLVVGLEDLKRNPNKPPPGNEDSLNWKAWDDDDRRDDVGM